MVSRSKVKMKTVPRINLIFLCFFCSGVAGFVQHGVRFTHVPTHSSLKVPSFSKPPVRVSRSLPPETTAGDTLAGRAKSVLQKYLELNENKPFRTKAFSAAAVQGMGDFLSQILMAWLSHTRFQWDVIRTLTFMTVGLIYKGPVLHMWYMVLNRFAKFTKREMDFSKNKQSLSAMALDQTLGVWTFYPFYYIVYEIVTALLAGQVPNFVAIKAKMASKLLPIIFAQYSVWPMAQFISFKYCPPPLRVLYTNTVAVFWNCFMCARMAGA